MKVDVLSVLAIELITLKLTNKLDEEEQND